MNRQDEIERQIGDQARHALADNASLTVAIRQRVTLVSRNAASGPILTFASQSGLDWSKCQNHQDH